MQVVDIYTEMKKYLLGLYINLMNRRKEIVGLIFYCPYLAEDRLLLDSYSKLIDTYNNGIDNSISLLTYINNIENNNLLFSVFDILDEYNMIRENILLFNYYYNHMIDYINFCNDRNNTYKDIQNYKEKYLEKDNYMYEEINTNRNLIKQLHKERGEDF